MAASVARTLVATSARSARLATARPAPVAAARFSSAPTPSPSPAPSAPPAGSTTRQTGRPTRTAWRMECANPQSPQHIAPEPTVVLLPRSPSCPPSYVLLGWRRPGARDSVQGFQQAGGIDERHLEDGTLTAGLDGRNCPWTCSSRCAVRSESSLAIEGAAGTTGQAWRQR
ncbi:hypothetical protein BJY59DRAFT_692861 [Rhodotorula toruloides]